jgi:hypothetical protein
MLGEGDADVRTFLIADVRGYTRFTEEYGDEVAARLAAKFADVVQDGVEARGGSVVEIRGDEALAVFKSARQAIRAAVDLQAHFDEETEADSELPLRVGIGVDSGEAVLLEDGSYRGAALKKNGSKHHLLVDASGIPLAWTVTGGNRHDVTQLIPLVDRVPPVRGKVGRPRRRPDRLTADRGYDHDTYRRELRQRGIASEIARRQTEHGSGLGRVRWVVESAPTPG